MLSSLINWFVSFAATEQEGIDRLHTLESIAGKWAQYEGQLDDISAWVHNTQETIETGPAKMSHQQQLHMLEVCTEKFVPNYKRIHIYLSVLMRTGGYETTSTFSLLAEVTCTTSPVSASNYYPFISIHIVFSCMVQKDIEVFCEKVQPNPVI